MRPAQVTDTAAEGQPADAGGGDDAARSWPCRGRRSMSLNGPRWCRPRRSRCARRRRRRPAASRTGRRPARRRPCRSPGRCARPRGRRAPAAARAPPDTAATSSASAQRTIAAGRASIIRCRRGGPLEACVAGAHHLPVTRSAKVSQRLGHGAPPVTACAPAAGRAEAAPSLGAAGSPDHAKGTAHGRVPERFPPVSGLTSCCGSSWAPGPASPSRRSAGAAGAGGRRRGGRAPGGGTAGAVAVAARTAATRGTVPRAARAPGAPPAPPARRWRPARRSGRHPGGSGSTSGSTLAWRNRRLAWPTWSGSSSETTTPPAPARAVRPERCR